MNANKLEKVSSNQSENEINESRIEISGKNNRKNECIIKGSPPFEKIDMKVNGLMINLKGMEKVFIQMVIVI